MDKLQEVVNRPKRYDYVDGTGDMFAGLSLLGFALAARLEALLRVSAPRWEHLFVPLVPALAIAAGWPLRSYIKNRWTWRRTGYAAYRVGGKRSLTTIAAAGVIGAAVSAGFARMVMLAMRAHEMSLVGIGYVLLFAGLYAFWIAATSPEQRWKWLIFLVMVLGLLAIELPAHGDLPRVFWQASLFLGLAWLASAAGHLLSYIRHTQPPAAEAE